MRKKMHHAVMHPAPVDHHLAVLAPTATQKSRNADEETAAVCHSTSHNPEHATPAIREAIWECGNQVSARVWQLPTSQTARRILVETQLRAGGTERRVWEWSRQKWAKGCVPGQSTQVAASRKSTPPKKVRARKELNRGRRPGAIAMAFARRQDGLTLTVSAPQRPP